MAEEGKTVYGGIRLKEITIKTTEIDLKGKKSTANRKVLTGKPECYYIRDEFDASSYQEVPAENVIHKFDVTMPGQLIGMPGGACVINQLHDFEDLHILEMGAAKLAGQIGVVESNATGEVQSNNARQTRLGIAGVDSLSNPATRQIPYDYQVMLGAQKIGLFKGDKLDNFMVNRPTVVQQEYWNFLLNAICNGYKTPLQFVDPHSVQGTIARMDISIARDAYRFDFELVSQVLCEIYQWWGEKDKSYDTSNYGKAIPTDYNACEIHPPDGPDVDIGYTAQSLAIEMELGVTNLAQVCGRRGLSWRSLIKQSAQIQKAIQDEAIAAGVTPESISFHLMKSGKTSDPNAEPAMEPQDA
jgi:hypothetical protein